MADLKDVHVPDIGDFADVPVIEVMVNPGDTVAAEDPLVTLESDKATMDVPAPFGGVVQELKVKTGDTVSEGSLLLTLAVDGANGSQPDQAAGVSEPAPEAGAADAARTAVQAEDAAEPAPPPDVQEPARAAAEPARPVDQTPPAAAGQPSDGPVYAGPGVRRLARERGVDLARVTGTGRKGRILKEDVEAYVSAPPTAPASGCCRGRRSTSPSSARSSACRCRA
jgi:pyruvate dehydrogenase E2 component (dihydrolipoamide acetyltransferase)